MRSSFPRTLLLLEDNSARSERRHVKGVSRGNSKRRITIRLHKIDVGTGNRTIVAQRAYKPGSKMNEAGRKKARMAFDLLKSVGLKEKAILVAGPRYGDNTWFVHSIAELKWRFVFELPPRVGDPLLRATKSTYTVTASG